MPLFPTLKFVSNFYACTSEDRIVMNMKASLPPFTFDFALYLLVMGTPYGNQSNIG